MTRLIAVNEQGLRIGETHHNAKLTDLQVEEMRDLFEAVHPDHPGEHWGYKRLARRFGVAKGTVRNIVHYLKRAQYADGWRRV